MSAANGHGARLALLVFVAGCSAPENRALRASPGTSCSPDNSGACETPTRLLICKNQMWVIASDCKGPDGCTLVTDTYTCDLRGNTAGDHCPSQSEGKVRCEPDGGANILRCRDGLLSIELRCPSPTACVLTPAAGLNCR